MKNFFSVKPFSYCFIQHSDSSVLPHAEKFIKVYINKHHYLCVHNVPKCFGEINKRNFDNKYFIIMSFCEDCDAKLPKLPF